MKIKKLYELILLSAGVLFPQMMNAQETLAGFNWASYGEIYLEETNASLKNLTDKNDATNFVVDTSISELSITYEVAEPFVLTSYTFLSSYNEGNDPEKWKLEYSEDGSTWKLLHLRTKQVFPTRNYPLNLKTGLIGGVKGHQFYRFTIMHPESKALKFELAEVQLFGSTESLKSNIVQNGGSISEKAGIGGELTNLVDNSFTIYKQTEALPYWIQYESSKPVVLKEYTLVSGRDVTKAPRTWELHGSNDGVSWDILDVQRNKNTFDAPFSTQIYKINDNTNQPEWSAIADALYKTLVDDYWRSYSHGGKYFIFGYDRDKPNSNALGYNYWWQAHGLDIFVDRYQRTKDVDYQIKINELSQGLVGFCKTQNLPDYYHGFYDDMEWLAIAFLRNYNESKNPVYLNRTITLWNWIAGGWSNVQGGGIAWSTGTPNGKNACSNAPAIILACRLYEATGDEAYLDFAKKIYDWMSVTLIDSETGLVWDNIHYKKVNDVETSESEIEKAVWTYNVGTWIGACHDLYRSTGDTKYLNNAFFSADYAISDYQKFSRYGVVSNGEGGSADGGLFKGIFFRYLAELVMNENIDSTRKSQYMNYLVGNGETVWNAGILKPEISVAPNWFEKPKQAAQTSSTVMSGVMLFEALTALKDKGLLESRNPIVEENSKKEYKYFKLFIHNSASGNINSGIELSEWQLFASGSGAGVEEDIRLENKIDVQVANKNINFQPQTEGISYSYFIYDLNGQICAKGEASTAYSVNLNKGVYIVSVVFEGQKITKKIIL